MKLVIFGGFLFLGGCILLSSIAVADGVSGLGTISVILMVIGFMIGICGLKKDD